jgi:hypothetical protein
MEERKAKLNLLTNQPLKLQLKGWNNIFLPSTTSPPNDLRPKPPPLLEQFLGGAQGLPTFFSRV